MSTPDEFDWLTNDAVVVLSQPGTAVYLNPHGQVVVRQEGHYGPEEDAWIYLSIENVPQVTRAMLEAAGYETETTYGNPLPKTQPLSGAERQRRYRNNKRNGNGFETVAQTVLIQGDAPRDEERHQRDVTERPFALIAAE